jgi:hypothetical protein
MANSVVPSFSLTYTFGNLQDQIPSETYNYTPAASGKFSQQWNVTTTEVTLAIGSSQGVPTLNYVFFYNLDASNYVEIGHATGSYMMKLLAGQFAFFPAEPSITFYAKANTATVALQVNAYNA